MNTTKTTKARTPKKRGVYSRHDDLIRLLAKDPGYVRLVGTLIDRTSNPGGCWLWLGDLDGKGYGYVSFRGKQLRALRIALFLETGTLRADRMACHECDNPPCCRTGWGHLFWGTSTDNQQHMSDRGRARGGPNSKHPRPGAEPRSREYIAELKLQIAHIGRITPASVAALVELVAARVAALGEPPATSKDLVRRYAKHLASPPPVIR